MTSAVVVAGRAEALAWAWLTRSSPHMAPVTPAATTNAATASRTRLVRLRATARREAAFGSTAGELSPAGTAVPPPAPATPSVVASARASGRRVSV